MSIKAVVIIVALIWITTLLFKKTLRPTKTNIHSLIKKLLLARPEFASKSIISLNLIGGVNYTLAEYKRVKNIIQSNFFEELSQENYTTETDTILVYSVLLHPNQNYIITVIDIKGENNQPYIKDVFPLV